LSEEGSVFAQKRPKYCSAHFRVHETYVSYGSRVEVEFEETSVPVPYLVSGLYEQGSTTKGTDDKQKANVV
jgi:hypothetical protein